MVHNRDLAEWLALEADSASGMLQKAYRRASRAAFLWPVEAQELIERGGSLEQLPAIGPFLAKVLKGWLDKAPARTKPPADRDHFLTLAQSKRVLADSPLGSFNGDLQMHSVWSDGAGTILEMAEAAIARQYKYIAITDHSKGLKIAGGMDEETVHRQGLEIANLNAQLCSRNFRVLRGLELNLNPAGEGDMNAAALHELDIVVGSFHSKLRVKEDQTERYLAALGNPHVHILGHPRGRIYNFRIGLKADWRRVFSKALELDKALEVDCYPDRQDLDVSLLKMACEMGVRIAIDTDAHAPEQLRFIELGMAAAVLSDYPSDRIINCMPCEQLLEWTGRLHQRAQAA